VDPLGLGGEYVYLLGLYLGDGMLTDAPRRVWRLRITLDERYPGIIERCKAAIEQVSVRNAGAVKRPGCFEIYSNWKHWFCVSPQHGVGPKHTRPIELEEWQRWAVAQYPHELLTGLIHSDGCRVINKVVTRGKPYEYPRYHFTNHSDDILRLFTDTCQLIGVECRPNNRWNLSAAKRHSVALLDSFIGPKR
jgi:hypothetical protein